jgi:hypothetical protein
VEVWSSVCSSERGLFLNPFQLHLSIALAKFIGVAQLEATPTLRMALRKFFLEAGIRSPAGQAAGLMAP